MAIATALQSGVLLTVNAEGQLYFDIPEKIWMASLFIGLAAVVDFADGFLARLLKADSAMGKQLDSLADLVSFGVAPALIVFQFLRLSWAQDPDAMDLGSFTLWPAFMLPLAAAWRLARFNLASGSLHHFSGLPVPAAGMLVASLPLIYWNTNEAWLTPVLLAPLFWYGLVGLLSFLMVSTIPLLTLKFSSYGWNTNQPRYLLLGLSLLLLLWLHWLAFPLIIVLYVLLSLLFKKQLA